VGGVGGFCEDLLIHGDDIEDDWLVNEEEVGEGGDGGLGGDGEGGLAGGIVGGDGGGASLMAAQWAQERADLLRRLEEYTVEVEQYRLEREGERQQAAEALVVSEAVDSTAIVTTTGSGSSGKESGRGGSGSSGNSIFSSSNGNSNSGGSSRTNLLGDSSASSVRLAAQLALSSDDPTLLRLELTRQLDRCDHARASYAHLLQKLQAVKGNIQVVCRARPPSAQERVLADAEETGGGSGSGSGVGGMGMSGGKICVDVTDDNEVCCYDRRADSWKSFVFDRVWPVDATQGEVFADVEPLVLSVVEGYNTCLFAYGQVRLPSSTRHPSLVTPYLFFRPLSPLSLA
jgi:hypothetical protein